MGWKPMVVACNSKPRRYGSMFSMQWCLFLLVGLHGLLGSSWPLHGLGSFGSFGVPFHGLGGLHGCHGFHGLSHGQVLVGLEQWAGVSAWLEPVPCRKALG